MKPVPKFQRGPSKPASTSGPQWNRLLPSQLKMTDFRPGRCALSIWMQNGQGAKRTNVTLCRTGDSDAGGLHRTILTVSLCFCIFFFLVFWTTLCYRRENRLRECHPLFKDKQRRSSVFAPESPGGTCEECRFHSPQTYWFKLFRDRHGICIFNNPSDSYFQVWEPLEEGIIFTLWLEGTG